MRYDVVLIKSAEGYAVHCPALPPCWSQEETREAAFIRGETLLWWGCIRGL